MCHEEAGLTEDSKRSRETGALKSVAAAKAGNERPASSWRTSTNGKEAEMSKQRIYAFHATNTETKEVGQYFLAAANTEAAEGYRWAMHNDANCVILCSGYVGPLCFYGWEETARGFVSEAVLTAEYEAVHGPPKMKTVVNLMSGKEMTIRADTPNCCDPSSETYWSM
jgi:hypothetical protein